MVISDDQNVNISAIRYVKKLIPCDSITKYSTIDFVTLSGIVTYDLQLQALMHTNDYGKRRQ